MTRLHIPRLFLLIGGIGLLVLAAAVSTGLAGVIWLLVGLAVSALIHVAGQRVHEAEAAASQPEEQDFPGFVEVEPEPVEAPEPTSGWGNPIALLPAPRPVSAAEETHVVHGTPRRRRKNRPRFLPTRIRLRSRRQEAAQPGSAVDSPRPTSKRQGEEVVVAEVTTYQRGRPPVVQRVRLRFRGVSVKWKTASPAPSGEV